MSHFLTLSEPRTEETTRAFLLLVLFDVLLQGNATETPVQGTYTGEAKDWSFLARVMAEQPDLDVVCLVYI